eukprot:m.35758 g.35758  ORF g.35758 m.35758 type:complete len:106 (+) comp44298_c0_seq3:44-361(+)
MFIVYSFRLLSPTILLLFQLKRTAETKDRLEILYELLCTSTIFLDSITSRTQNPGQLPTKEVILDQACSALITYDFTQKDLEAEIHTRLMRLTTELGVADLPLPL